MSDLAYLAGVLDGEGCFNVARCRSTYVPRILVVNTNEDLVSWLRATFGGDVTRTSVKNKPNWKPRYQWRLSHQKALDLAQRVMSFLRVKRAQANIFAAWADARVCSLRDRRRVYPEFTARIRHLNQKGIQ